MTITISETSDGRMWRIGGKRFIDIGAVLDYLEEIKHSGGVLLNEAPTHAEFAALGRELNHAGYTVGFGTARTAPTASDTPADLASLRARVAELEQRIAAAQGIIDTNADALTGWRARDFAEAMRAALKGGE